MIEKRFYIAESNLIDGYCVFDREKKYAFHPRSRRADCLNDAHILNELHEENQIFREALKELKEIGRYQAMRIRELSDENSLIEDEIDKKIAVLTDAKIKSFQNEDKELLRKIKFSIQVLRELKEVILK